MAQANLREAMRRSSARAGSSGVSTANRAEERVAESAPERGGTADLPGGVQPPEQAITVVAAPSVQAWAVRSGPTLEAISTEARGASLPASAPAESSPAPAVRLESEARPPRVEISNGNGVPGMAARVSRWFTTQGLPVRRLTNQRPFTQRQTVIQYRSGHEEAALRMSHALPVRAAIEPAPAMDLRSDLRLVLGHDWTRLMACLTQACQLAPLAQATER
jgi:hypothetical protein